jgi:hypothetical protein
MERMNVYVSLEVCICLYVRGWYFLVIVSETINMSDGTATRWNDTLYIITNLVRSLRSASDGKLIILSISDTLWYLLQMYRAPQSRRWTISIFLMDSDVWGFQIEHEYSDVGLTSAWYAWVFICWFDVFRFRFKKPSALLPFDIMSFMCLSHLRLDCTVIPRRIFNWAHRSKYMVMEDVIVL